MYRITYDGELETVVPNVGWTQGTQVLTNGDYALAQRPEIKRITPDGSISNLSTSSSNEKSSVAGTTDQAMTRMEMMTMIIAAMEMRTVIQTQIPIQTQTPIQTRTPIQK